MHIMKKKKENGKCLKKSVLFSDMVVKKVMTFLVILPSKSIIDVILFLYTFCCFREL